MPITEKTAMKKDKMTPGQLAYEKKELHLFFIILTVFLAVCAGIYIFYDNTGRAQYSSMTPIIRHSAADDIPESEKVNINTASKEELMTVNGIGSVTADNIIDYREHNNGFLDVDELLQVHGIGEKSLDKMRPYLTA